MVEKWNDGKKIIFKSKYQFKTMQERKPNTENEGQRHK